MRKLSKFIVVCLVLLMTVSLFSGCADKDVDGDKEKVTTTEKTTTKEKETEPKEKVKVVVWSNSRHDLDVMEAEVEKFNTANEGVIEVEYIAYADKYEDSVNIAFQTGQGPDVFNYPKGAKSEAFIEQGYIQSLDDLATSDFTSRFNPSMQEKYGGKLYGIVPSVVTFRLIYNKDLFKASGLDPEKPPATLSEMRDYSLKIKEASDGKAYGLALAFKSWKGEWNAAVATIVTSSYGHYFFDANTGKYNYSSFSPIIKTYLDMQEDGTIMPSPTTLMNDPARAAFSEGIVGMWFGGSYDVGVLNDQFPAKCDWGVAPIPTIDGSPAEGKTLALGGGGWKLSGNTKNPEESWKVYEWLYSDELAQTLQKAGKINSTNQNAAKPEYFSDVKGAKDFVVSPTDSLYMHPTPYVKPEGLPWATVLENTLAEGKDVDEKLKELDERYNAQLDQIIKDGTIDINEYLAK